MVFQYFFSSIIADCLARRSSPVCKKATLTDQHCPLSATIENKLHMRRDLTIILSLDKWMEFGKGCGRRPTSQPFVDTDHMHVTACVLIRLAPFINLGG
jgi:hypothetical protein